MSIITPDEYRKLTAPKKSKRIMKAEYVQRYTETPPAAEQSQADADRQRALFERHDNVVIKIRLPLAPTLNNYRAIFQPKDKRGRPTGRARLITSAQGRAYVEAVEYFWQRRFRGWPPDPLTGRIRLLVEVHMARNGRSDISNRIKALEDALTEAGAWIDDSQVDDLRVIRGDVMPPTGAMDVIIESIGE